LGEKLLHNELLYNFQCIFPGFRSQQPSNAGKNLMPQLGIRQREASISSLPTKWAGNSRYHITNPSIQAK